MRLPDNGRAGYPKIRPSSVRHYTLNNARSVDEADRASSSSVALLAEPSWAVRPARVQAPTWGALRFDSTVDTVVSEAGVDTELQAVFTGGPWTVALLFRMLATPAVEGTLIYLGGVNDDSSSDNNLLFRFSIRPTRAPRLFWERTASQTNVQTDFSTAVLDLNRWHLAHIVYDGSTALSLVINGALVSTVTGKSAPSLGSASVLMLGGELAVGSVTADNVPDADLAFVGVYAEAFTEEQCEEDARQVRLLDCNTHVDVSVRVTDQTGAAADLTDLSGVDGVDTVEITDEADSAATTARITLIREMDLLSVASFDTASRNNLTDVGDPTSYLALLTPGALIEVLAARVPLGLRAAEGDLESVFQGAIDDIDEGGDQVSLSCRDGGGALIDTMIEEEVNYGDATPVAVEGEMQFILNDNDSSTVNNSVAGLVARTGSYAPLTLYTPVAPGWAILTYRQQRESVLSALRALAVQIGWDVRYRFDQSPTQKAWRLTFYEPDRARAYVDVCFRPDDILEVQQLTRSLLGVRNVFRVIYPSSETTLPSPPAAPSGYTVRSGWAGVDGEGLRMVAFVEVQSDVSIALHGRRLFMEATEDSASQIDTVNEAYDMAYGGVRDLEESDIGANVKLPLTWEMELNDVAKFNSNARFRLFTAAQTLAVKRVTHSFVEGPSTTVQLRGKPTIGFKRWLRLDARQGRAGVMRPLDALTDVNVGRNLATLRGILDRTRFLTGGKFLAIRNPDFEGFSAGMQNPPDGWTMSAGAWETNITVSTTSLSGARSIDFNSTTPIILSDWIQLPAGDLNTPFSLEAIWQRVSGDDLIQIDVQWWDQAKTTLLGTTSIYPGSGTYGFPAVPATTGAWYTSRAQGFCPPSASARYVRLAARGRLVGGAFDNVLLDQVAMYRTGRELLAGMVAVGTYGWAAVGASLYNQSYGDIVGAGFYDRGNNFVDDSGSAPNHKGYHFYCREPGTYEVDVVEWVLGQGTVLGTKTLEIQLVLNGTYTATETRATGSVLSRFRSISAFNLIDVQPLRLRHIVDLVEGDRLTVDLGYVATTAGGGTYALGAGPGTDPSIFRVKLRGAD